MITVDQLVKRYGSKVAVDALSFEVDKGEVVGFLGPNGAGKTTTLRILSGFLGMTSGRVTVAGHDIEHDSHAARQKIGYMPEAVPLYPEMRVAEYLAFRAELKRVPRRDRPRFIDDAMTKANITSVASVLIGHLSKGYKQRVGLADALVARPSLLILDEPTAGLDPNQVREVRDVLRDLRKEHTVLLSTHILSEVEASCSRVIVIAEGRLVAQGTMMDLARKRRADGIRIVVRGERDAALEVLRAIPHVANASAAPLDGPEARDTDAPPNARADVSAVQCAWKSDVDHEGAARATEEVVAALVGAGMFVRAVRPIESTLEDVFAELTRAKDQAAAEER